MQVAPGMARAHQGEREDVRVVLDGVEPPVAGLRVQVYDDALAPQLVLENQSGRVLEIFDEQGRAFVRIKAAGVEADFAAGAWYRSLNPGGASVPERARTSTAEPDWRAVRTQPSWGWFDPRLDKERAELHPASDVPVTLGQWRVPARFGAQEIEIRGHFLYLPRPGGVFMARLTSGPEIAPGLRVTLAPGRPPALLLENTGPDSALVLGGHDEPFLRVSADGVEANLTSPTWQDLGRYRGLGDASEGAAGGAPRWRKVSLAPRYSWLEPRAGMPSLGEAEGPRPDNTRAKVKGWQVPVLVGRRRLAIQGVVEWVPLPSAILDPGRDE